MKSRYLSAVGAALLVVVGVTLAQQPKVAPLPPPPDYSAPVVPHAYTPPSAPPVYIQPQALPTAREAKPDEMTLEQLLDAVDGFRAQKAELEKKEKAFMKVVHQKAGKLKERIEGIDGVTPPVIRATEGPGVPVPGIGPGGLPPTLPPTPAPMPQVSR